MKTEMNSIFTDNVLNQLSQLPVGTIIEVNGNDIAVFKDACDLKDFVPSHRFFKTTIWADEHDTRYYQVQGAKKGE